MDARRRSKCQDRADKLEQDGESMHGRDNGRLGESEPSVLDVRRGEIHAKANR
jgi:hypothetical protein